MGFSGSRARPTRTFCPRPVVREARPQHGKGLPTVFIQGTSLNRIQSARGSARHSLDYAVPRSSPTPTPTEAKPQILTVKDVSEKLQSENIFVNGHPEAKQEESVQESLPVPPADVMLDKTLDIASLSDDDSRLSDSDQNTGQERSGPGRPKTAIVRGKVHKMEDVNNRERVSISECNIDQDTTKTMDPVVGNSPILRAQSAKTKASKVRFADQIDMVEPGTEKPTGAAGDNVTFFLTEDRDKKGLEISTQTTKASSEHDDEIITKFAKLDNNLGVEKSNSDDTECNKIEEEDQAKNSLYDNNLGVEINSEDTECNKHQEEAQSENSLCGETERVELGEKGVESTESKAVPTEQSANQKDCEEVLSFSSEESKPYVTGVDIITSKSSTDI